MARFKLWVENIEAEKMKDIQNIWTDTFKTLGVSGLSDIDAAQQSLSKINFGSRRPDNSVNNFKGKQAVHKRLENGQIFTRLRQINDPELAKNVEDAERWLNSSETPNNGTTIGNLLQRMFGNYFQKLIDGDFPQVNIAKASVEPQPPKESPMNGSSFTEPLPQSNNFSPQNNSL